MSALVSFHGGHSAQFCDHAKSSLEEIVQSYVAAGFSHVGISEHQPRYKDFLYPDELALGRSSADLFSRFEEYFIEARRLQAKYAGQIKLLVGFETEYCGSNALQLIEQLRTKYRPDYIVGSVHHVDDLPIDFDRETYNQALKKSRSQDSLYFEYYEHQLDLIKSCRPEVIGHLDLIKIFSKDAALSRPAPLAAKVARVIKRNIKFIASYGGVIEINARAFHKGLKEPYPAAEILAWIAEAGAEITLGDDSHGAEQIGLNYDKMLAVVRNYFSQITAFERGQDGTLKKIELAL